MIKKAIIGLIFLLFFSLNNVDARCSNWVCTNITEWIQNTSNTNNWTQWWWANNDAEANQMQNDDYWSYNWWASNSTNSTSCTWPNCLNSTEFMINTNDITPWNKTYDTWDLTGTTNNLLSTIIQNLMVAIWVIALLVMSIWAWYMIFYHWQDEMLSKWKTMFTTWITALVIALSSYYLVSLVRFILYNQPK